jgi:hypothetical protein
MLLKTSAFSGSPIERKLSFNERNLAAYVMLKGFVVPREFFDALETISSPETQQKIGLICEGSFTLEEAAGQKNSQALQKAIALLRTIQMFENPETTSANFERQPIRPETEYQFKLRLEPKDKAYYFSIPAVRYEIKMPQLLGEVLSDRIRMKDIELDTPVYVAFHQNDKVFSLTAKPKLKILPGPDLPRIDVDTSKVGFGEGDYAGWEVLLPGNFSGSQRPALDNFVRP